MRIAHVIGTFPPHVGGMGKVAYDECMALSRLGHEVVVFTMAYQGVRYDDSALPFRVVRLEPKVKMGDGGFVPELYKHLRGFDIVHMHYPWYGAGFFVWFASVMERQAYVLTYHMDAKPTSFFKKIIQWFADMFISRLLFGRAEQVYIVNEDLLSRSKAGRYVRYEQKRLLPNGVDVELFRAGIARSKYILFVGNLLPLKRLDLLLQSLKELDDSEVKLTVAGGGYAEREYQKMADELGLEKQVTFLGRVTDQKQLAELYANAWCTIVPSAYESFSLVAIEAMAAGCPVVMSDVPGADERVDDGETGYLFETGSVRGLTLALRKMLSVSPERRHQMGVEARMLVGERYSLDAHVQSLARFYSEVKQ